MNREYDIFEKLSDGRVVWRAFVRGLEAARARVAELAGRSKHEFFAMDMLTKNVAARVKRQSKDASRQRRNLLNSLDAGRQSNGGNF